MVSNYERSVLITGGTSGLGYECALEIARQKPNYLVVIASRSDPEHAAEHINHILSQRNVRHMTLDLSATARVRTFASEWLQSQFPPIHSMIFNAALQVSGKIQYSDDGFEKTFAISHVGHALLFSLLRPQLVNDARIIIVSSGVHDAAQKSGLPDAQFHSAEELAHPPKRLVDGPGRQHYTNAKLANMLYTYALARRFRGINERHGKHWTVNSFDPGLMPGTGLVRDANSVLRFLWSRVLPRISPLLRLLYTPNVHTARESALSLVRISMDDEMANTMGEYFEGRVAIKSSKASYDVKKQEALWEWTINALAKTEEEKRMFDLKDLD